MSHLEWAVTSVSLLVAVLLIVLALTVAFSPEPSEDSPYV
jgi:hypothetical protein